MFDNDAREELDEKKLTDKMGLYKKGALAVLMAVVKFGNENKLGPDELTLIIKLSAKVGEAALQKMKDEE